MPSLTSFPVHRALSLSLLVAIGACGSSSDSTSPDTGSNSGLHLTAKIDGAAFVVQSSVLRWRRPMDRLLHFLLKTFIRRGTFRVTTSRGTVFTTSLAADAVTSAVSVYGG